MGGEDTDIPDLVGVDPDGRRVLVIEAKFWAGLTGNQPVAYLDQLPKDVDSILMFIAPAMRFPTLWNELLRGCSEAELDVIQGPKPSTEFIAGTVNEKRVLALASWRSVLTYIVRELEADGQLDVAADVQQLRGLCERMDDDAFLPLRSEELRSGIGVRIGQFFQITDEVTNTTVADGFASTQGLRATGGFGWYGRYMRLHGYGCLLHFNAAHWARIRETPVWLRVTDSQWQVTRPLKAALPSLELEQPRRLIVSANELLVPPQLPFGVEKDQVDGAVLAQLREVAALLRAHDEPGGSTEGPREWSPASPWPAGLATLMLAPLRTSSVSPRHNGAFMFGPTRLESALTCVRTAPQAAEMCSPS